MAANKKITKKGPKPAQIPEEAIEHAKQEIADLDDWRVTSHVKGKYLYITAESAPLCRLKYLGSQEEWGLAVYKYSTSSYSTNEFGFPKQGAIRECVERALKAYGIC